MEDILLHIYDDIRFKKGKGTKSAFPIRFYEGIRVEDMDAMCETACNQDPILFIFVNSSGLLDRAIVGGDRSHLYLHANDVVGVLIGFISVFFVFRLEMEGEGGQLVGFLQEVLLGIAYNGPKSNGFIKMLDKFKEIC